MTLNSNSNRRGGCGGKISKRSIKSHGSDKSPISTISSLSKAIPDVNRNQVDEIRKNINDHNDVQRTNLQLATSNATHDHSPTAASMHGPH